MRTRSPIRAAVLTVSDRCSRGAAVDTSGPACERLLAERLGAVVVARACLPDEIEPIAALFRAWSDPNATIDLVVATGGTGFAPRDVTPEAARRVLEREAPGLMELARSRCAQQTPLTYLSRGVAGTIGRTLLLTLPGSERGATETLAALVDVLPHAIASLRSEIDPNNHPTR